MRLIQPGCIFQNHNLTKLRELINQKYDVQLNDYHELHGWSIQNYGQFWEEVWSFTGVISSVSPTTRWEEMYFNNITNYFTNLIVSNL